MPTQESTPLGLEECEHKLNFNVAIRASFAVAAAVLSNSSGDIIAGSTKNIISTEVNKGEALADLLLVVDLAIQEGCNNVILKGDSFVIILAINQFHLLADWDFSPIIANIHLKLQHFQDWSASKVRRGDNSRAHHLAK